jgi:copper chaperone NosL
MRHHKFSSVLLLLFFLILLSTSCGGNPEPINYGHDECEFCRMLITDNRYGSEIVTDKGKVFKFDEVSCMIEYALVKNLIGDANHKFLVTDFSKPETFTDAPSAVYVHNEDFRSPMGLNVSAFGDASAREKFVLDNGGETLSWVEIIQMVKHRSM